MLSDIRLTAEQAAVLAQAAVEAGGEFRAWFRGPFDPAVSGTCVALVAPSAGVLLRLGGILSRHPGISEALLGQLASRTWATSGGPGRNIYYWPGILWPSAWPEGGTEPAEVTA